MVMEKMVDFLAVGLVVNKYIRRPA